MKFKLTWRDSQSKQSRQGSAGSARVTGNSGRVRLGPVSEGWAETPTVPLEEEPAGKGLPRGLQTSSTSSVKPASSRGQAGGNNVMGVFIKNIREGPERKGQRSLVEATGKTSQEWVKKAGRWQLPPGYVWRDSPCQPHGARLCSHSCPRFIHAHGASGPHSHPWGQALSSHPDNADEVQNS